MQTVENVPDLAKRCPALPILARVAVDDRSDVSGAGGGGVSTRRDAGWSSVV